MQSNEPMKFIKITVGNLYTLHNLNAKIPVGCLTAVTGLSGSGKSTLVLDCLIPAMNAHIKKTHLPGHVSKLDTMGIKRVVAVDAIPVGKNARSTVATYTGIMDGLRALFAQTPEAKKRGWDVGYFSYNVENGACATCNGTGEVSLDIQYLPDMDITCPDCGGKRYKDEVLQVKWSNMNIAEVLKLTVDDALEIFKKQNNIHSKLESLEDLGLGYLELGEATPQLSGGEAQRLKLVSEIGKKQSGTLFVFDEPTTGLHPKDIRKLLQVLDNLIEAGGTVIVIEHDLDMIANADYIIDMGPEGGDRGGRIVAEGTPDSICKNPESITGRFLRDYAGRYGIKW